MSDVRKVRWTKGMELLPETDLEIRDVIMAGLATLARRNFHSLEDEAQDMLDSLRAVQKEEGVIVV